MNLEKQKEYRLAILQYDERSQKQLENIQTEMESRITSTTRKYESERRAREEAELSLKKLEVSFKDDWEAKLKLAAIESAAEGARQAREALRSETTQEVQTALRLQKEKLTKEWNERLNNAVEAAVEQTADAAAEEGSLALQEAEASASQRQAQAIMEAVTEATSIAMEEAAENKARALTEFQNASSEALQSQKVELEALHNLRLERQMAEATESANAWERKILDLKRMHDEEMNAQKNQLEMVKHKALQSQLATLEASKLEALAAAKRSKLAAINELKAEFAMKWKTMAATYDEMLKEVRYEAEKLVTEKINQVKRENDNSKSEEIRGLQHRLWSVEKELESSRYSNHCTPSVGARIQKSTSAAREHKQLEHDEEDIELMHIETAQVALDISHSQDRGREDEVQALRETSKILKGRIRRAMQKEQKARAAAAQRAREDRLHQRQERLGVGHSGLKSKHKKSRATKIGENRSSPSSTFSPRTTKELQTKAFEVQKLKNELARANAKIEHLTRAQKNGLHFRGDLLRNSQAEDNYFDVSVRNRSLKTKQQHKHYTPRMRGRNEMDIIDVNDETQQILNWLDSPAGKAATIAAGQDFNLESQESERNHHSVEQHGEYFERSWRRPPGQNIVTIRLGSIKLLEQEKQPLKAMFEFYASKRKMVVERSTQLKPQLKAKPTMFMTHSDFNRFCFDFKIIPGV